MRPRCHFGILILVVACFLLLPAATIAKEAKAKDSNKPPSILQRLQFWKSHTPQQEDKDEAYIPEWSEFAKKEDPNKNYGVDDYSTGETKEYYNDNDDVTTTKQENDNRPPPPKEAPPPPPDEIGDDDFSESSVGSDLTVDDDDGADNVGDVPNDEFHDAQEDIYYDAVQEELWKSCCKA